VLTNEEEDAHGDRHNDTPTGGEDRRHSGQGARTGHARLPPAALEDLNRAREHAQHDAQAGIDDATERIRAAADDMRRRLREEADELQTRLDRASEEARVELGRVAIRAQRTPDALGELAREIRRVKDSMKDDTA